MVLPMNRKHILVTVLLSALLLGQVCAFPVFAEQAPAVDNGLPVLYVNVDETAEGFGTVAEMNASPDHSVSCTRAQAVTFLHRMQPQR